MRATVVLPLAAFLMVLAMASPLPAADNPPLSADEVKKLVNAGQYQDALKALIRILELKGNAAAAYDRHEMLMLRAECLLQTRQTDAAQGALELARKEAADAANDDQAMEASALSMLIKQSPSGIYTPQTGVIRKPIPINDRILRKAAYNAMFADQLAQITLKLKQAKATNKLPPIADAAKQAVALRPIEHVSAGDNKTTDRILTDLSTDAQKLVVSAIDDLTADVARISESANRVITQDVTFPDAHGHVILTQQSHRMGLTPQDTQSLKNDIAEAAKLAAAAADLAGFFTNDAATFKTIGGKATAAKNKANLVLTDDYTGVIANKQ